MKHHRVIVLTSVLIALLTAWPVAAAGPQPERPPRHLDPSVEAQPFSESSEEAQARGSAPQEAPALPEAAHYAEEAKTLEAAAESEEAAPQARAVLWTARTSLWRSGGTVYSEGRNTSTYGTTYYMYVANYLCRFRSCTNWTSFAAYWRNWVRAGWHWRSSYANWFTRSRHYFSDGRGHVWNTYRSVSRWY